jgi:hypothetical protein
MFEAVIVVLFLKVAPGGLIPPKLFLITIDHRQGSIAQNLQLEKEPSRISGLPTEMSATLPREPKPVLYIITLPYRYCVGAESVSEPVAESFEH